MDPEAWDWEHNQMWEVAHDGPSRPIIFTPDKRMLSLSQWENGRWVSYEQEESDCAHIVESMGYENALRNLLAIIHRDGGHYAAEHGIKKAVEDAHKVWAELRTKAGD